MPSRDPDASGVSRAILFGGLAVIAYYAACFALAPAGQPVLIPDSAGYLAVGRWVAGAGEVPQQIGVLYSWGYGALFTFPYLFSTDVSWAYAWGVTVNVLAGGGLFAVLVALLQRRWPGRPPRLIAAIAFVGAAWSGVALQVSQIWPVVPLAVLTAAWALSLQRLAQGERRASAELVVSSLALFGLHHRMAGIVAVTAWILIQHRERGRSPKALVALGCGCVLIFIVDRIVAAAIYPEGASGFEFQNALHEPWAFVRILVGEFWYVSAGTAGVALATVGRHERERLPMRAFLAAFAFTALVGAAQLAAAIGRGVPLRADFLAYGRYVSPFIPVLVVLGVGALVLDRRARPTNIAIGCAGLSGAEIVLNGSYPRPDFLALNSVGLLGSGLRPFPLDVLTPSLWAVGLAVTLVAALPRLRPTLAMSALITVIMAGTLLGASRLKDVLARSDNAGQDAVAVIDGLPPGAVTYVDSTAGSSTFVLLQMLRPERRFAFGRPEPGTREAWVVHGLRWKAPRGVPVRLLSPPGQFQSISCVGRPC